MSKFIIRGGNKLYGDVCMHGAKNSALPILAATFLCSGESIIHNCPDLSDVRASIKILESLGCKTEYANSTAVINSKDADGYIISDDLMCEMRSSIVFLGAALSKTGMAQMSFPGGCELGSRPIDLHLKALKSMGANISEQGGKLNCTVPEGKLHGEKIALSFPSVGATENIMLAAVLANGTTVLTNAAREPEIIDLADFLNASGAKIKNAGESTVIIEGVEKLYTTEHNVISDRIASISFMSFAAAAGGKLNLERIEVSHLAQVIPMLEEAGCKLKIYKDILTLSSDKRLKAVQTIRTMPYPGFPTDAQAPVMSMLTLAEGTSIFVENIFENRYKHVGELLKMGANIKVEGKVAVVEGVDRLYASAVKCTDLRGGAALLAAGLAAQGETSLTDICHIDRGYESIEKSLNKVGAKIKRID